MIVDDGIAGYTVAFVKTGYALHAWYCHQSSVKTEASKGSGNRSLFQRRRTGYGVNLFIMEALIEVTVSSKWACACLAYSLLYEHAGHAVASC